MVKKKVASKLKSCIANGVEVMADKSVSVCVCERERGKVMAADFNKRSGNEDTTKVKDERARKRERLIYKESKREEANIRGNKREKIVRERVIRLSYGKC